MTINELTKFLDVTLNKNYQERYDNAGLQVGDPQVEVDGVITCTDLTDSVIDEAMARKANVIVSHHPLIFGGIKNVTASDQTGYLITRLIHNNIAAYAAHTNLDNMHSGVNGILAKKIGLSNCRILRPMNGKLKKIVTYVPSDFATQVTDALFAVGAGKLGNYDHCSFVSHGHGTFRPLNGSTPFRGTHGTDHTEDEMRIEMLYEADNEVLIINALLSSHPYEMPAYDCIATDVAHPYAGAGMIGELTNPLPTVDFINIVKSKLKIPIVRTSTVCSNSVKRVAVCGGAGSFLIDDAVRAKADIYLTGDVKYHDFQHAADRIVLADIGHYESEQFAKELICSIISEKFHNFACWISESEKGYVFYI